ncbi:uncharacterized protein MONOS_15352 [Monocercomonoides exilis]|uniref:uncharacterized protein n=1 Tax=Monocercomonoides exilis TaxID=2049356 RepID=UPI00355997D8|nr:hypothetical protein MONOS_15352 [Monocercomonoides exilis]|eukprot:MONOS_15352.1-p1 / transcript=MONOS_15352.1 / gene=MONOS_15352 / organism=Monocercomonoides_exilis_PA203 / gene_product=unspecified product / transcript_product=unspecified product / location=Mono_scaffold01206:11182-11658(-) / protein_length=159 / sequence_SO=supercontig / SO=protein_coding / is_pseudo=false
MAPSGELKEQTQHAGTYSHKERERKAEELRMKMRRTLVFLKENAKLFASEGKMGAKRRIEWNGIQNKRRWCEQQNEGRRKKRSWQDLLTFDWEQVILKDKDSEANGATSCREENKERSAGLSEERPRSSGWGNGGTGTRRNGVSDSRCAECGRIYLGG